MVKAQLLFASICFYEAEMESGIRCYMKRLTDLDKEELNGVKPVNSAYSEPCEAGILPG